MMTSVDLVTKTDLELALATKQNSLNTNSVNGFNIDETGGNWCLTANYAVEGTVPPSTEKTLNIIQFESGHFRTQLAFDIVANASSSSQTPPPTSMWTRVAYAAQPYSNWISISLVQILSNYISKTSDIFSETDYAANIKNIFDKLPSHSNTKFGCGPESYVALYKSLLKKLADDGFTINTIAIEVEVNMPSYKYHPAIFTLKCDATYKVFQFIYDTGTGLSKAKCIFDGN